jgi:hypothetical protein
MAAGEKYAGEPRVQSYLWSSSNKRNEQVPVSTMVNAMTMTKHTQWQQQEASSSQMYATTTQVCGFAGSQRWHCTARCAMQATCNGNPTWVLAEFSTAVHSVAQLAKALAQYSNSAASRCLQCMQATAQAVALAAAGSPTKRSTCAPAGQGGSPSSVGRKPAGPFSQGCDAAHHKIGLRN